MRTDSTKLSRRLSPLCFAAVAMLIASVVAVVPGSPAAAATSDLSVNVISARTEASVPITQGAPVGDFEYIINIDDTGTTSQKTLSGPCLPSAVGYPDSCEWVSIRGVPSGSSQIFTQGDQSDFDNATLNLPDGDYLISVLAPGYKLGGKHFSVPLDGTVVVELQPSPLPSATIQAAVFEDISPVNGAPDLPAEHGLAGFEAHVFDYGGEVTTDIFGNPIGAEYDVNGDYIPGSGGIVRSKCYVVEGGVDIGVVGPTVGACPTVTSNHAGFPDGLVVQGKVVIPNIGPNRYELTVIAPDGSTWIQTTTLEGNHGWDAWVMEGSTGLDTEFAVAGEPFPAAIFGYVAPTNDLPATGESGSVTGVVDKVRVYIPPKGGTGLPGTIWANVQGMKTDGPIPSPWIALNSLEQGDTAVYIGQGNPDGSFDITGVPDGNYVLTWWDEPQNYILDLLQITVAGGEVDMGVLPMGGWWSEFDGYVFDDQNRNGVRDPGEEGVSDFEITMRKRENSLMDRGAAVVTTDQDGYYVFRNAYPLTQWLVMEAYNDLFYTTGITYQADNQPNETTVLGAGVDVNLLPIIGLTGRLDWGVHTYDATGTNGVDPTNGGIVGTVSYDTTRAELDAAYAGAEDWQPSIPGLTVNLYEPVVCGTNVGAPCSDASGVSYEVEPLGGALVKGQLLNSVITENWVPPASDCVARDVDGNPLVFGVDQAITDSPNDCIEAPFMGTQFSPEFAAVDGNYGFGDGCFGASGGWNAATEECVDGSDPTVLPGGADYLVEVEVPNDSLGRPTFKVTREEDINVGEGDDFIPAVPPPACAGELHTVDVADFGTDNFPANTTFIPGVTIPASDPTDNATFADIGDSIYEGLPKPLCHTKLVRLANGSSIAPTFYFFTDVPLPGRNWGQILDDFTYTTDITKTLLGDRQGIPFAPIGIYDYSNQLVTTIESDYNGVFDVLLPSTNRINCASPSGVCGNMHRFVGNDPGIPGALNENYKPNYRTISADFEVLPGLIVPADLAPSQVGVVVETPGGQFNQVACAAGDGPQLYNLSQPYGSPGDAFTITGSNFGAAAGVITLDGQVLPSTAWNNTTIEVTIPTSTSTGPGQLMITNAAGRMTVNGITFHVIGGAYSPNIYEVGPGRTYSPVNSLPAAADHAIQDALDAAAASLGDDLVVVYPGEVSANPQINPFGAYYENLILTEAVKLQGVGPGSPDGEVPGTILNGGAFGGDGPVFNDWWTKVSTLSWQGNQNPADGAVITIFTSNGDFTGAYEASIDGFDIRGGNQQGFPGNINPIGGLPTGQPVGLSTQGGAIFANAYARNLQITNNVVKNNGGTYGTIRIGTPDLPQSDNQNEDIRIANNRVISNGGTSLAGGIGIFSGADNYEVADNEICGNFSAEYGGGLTAYGFSPNGKIHGNRVYFNASYDEGGGIMIAGELPNDPGLLTPGSGSVDIYDNQIQANLANDDGGGLRFLMPGDFEINVFNNVIANNVSTHEGGGVSLNDAPDVRFFNNTVMKNLTTATSVTSNGVPAAAGLSTSVHSNLLKATLPGSAADFSDPLMFNNIFWDNRAGSYSGGTVTGLGLAGDPTPINHWDIGTTSGPGLLTPTNSVLQTTTGTVGSASNSAADPLVVSEYDLSVAFTSLRNNPNFIGALLVAVEAPPELLGDYHLQTGSPAVDLGAASKTGVAAPPTDFDGDPRPNGAFDSGADELASLLAVVSSVGASPNPTEGAATVDLSAIATSPASPVTAAEYFIDTDPGQGSGTAMTINGSGPWTLNADGIDVSGLANGTYTIGVRAETAAGWGPVESTTLTVNVPVPVIPGIYFSTLANTLVPGTPSPGDDADVYLWDGGAFSRVFDAVPGSGLAGGADIDGLELTSPDDFYASFLGNGSVSGSPYADEDVLHYTSGGWTTFFDGSANGLGGGTRDLDAISVVDGTLYFSTINNQSIPGITGENDSDVYRWDGGSNYTSVFSAVGNSLPGSANVDGLKVLGPDHFYLSFSGTTTVVPGIGAVQDEDIVEFNSGTFSLFFDGTGVGLTANGRDVDGFDVVDDSAASAPSVTALTATPSPTEGAATVSITATATSPASTVTAAEWFFGPDLGQGNGTPMAVTGAGPWTLSDAAADVSTLPLGNNTLSVRAQDAAGDWSTVATAVVEVTAAPSTAPTVTATAVTPSPTLGASPVQLTATGTATAGRTIAAAEYTIDAGPPVPMVASDAAFDSIAEDVEASIDASALADGSYVISVRVQDSTGEWSAAQTTTLLVNGVPPAFPGMQFSTVTPTAVGAIGTPDDSDVYNWDGLAFSRLSDLTAETALPASEDVDALHWISPTDFYVSLIDGWNLPGPETSADEDVLHYDNGVWSVFFDGSANGIASSDIDGLSIVGGTMYFSTTANSNVPGVAGPFDDADVYSWDGSSFARVFDGTANGLPATADIDGLTVIDGTHFYASFGLATTNVLGLGAVQDEDVVEFDTGTWSLFFDGTAQGLTSAGLDLDAINVVVTP